MRNWTNLIKRIYNYLTSFSIELKIYGMVISVILLVTIISLFVVRISITQSLTNELNERGKSIASDVSARSVDYVITQNIYALNKLVSDTVDHYKDIEYLFILNPDNTVLVYSTEDQIISNELITANQIKKQFGTFIESLVVFQSEKGMIIDVAAPVMTDYGGTVRVGLRFDSLQAALNRITAQMVITMLGVLVLSGLIVLALTRTITYPITKLVELTGAVSKGDLTKRIEIFPNDEIGKLTNSFNEMLDHLENSEKSKKLFFDEIQNRNKELLLLNELSIATVTSIEQVKPILHQFVTHLVKELSLSTGILKVKLFENEEVFQYSQKYCVHDCMYETFQINTDNCKCKSKIKPINHQFSLVINNKKIGEIQTCSFKEMDPHLIQILNSLAKQLSMFIENVRLWNELKKKEEIRVKLLEKVIRAQEDERRRVARELHDETSHSLSSILLGLKLVNEAKSDEDRSQQVAKLREITENTMKEVHHLAWQLRPTILDKFGLTVALERYVEEYLVKYPIEIDLVIKGLSVENFRLKSEIETAIFRVVQEALTNISKYAKASFVSIIIIANKQQITIVIEDDGVGFKADEVLEKTPSQHNLGLHGMVERISLLGGSLNIESALGNGTTIYVKIPLIAEEVE
ncbi:sensor histidine kinase [Calidifontibacillus oryziterrae]|uniref:sensor histidine kinase n=1 Tax=Calidifontibacillus oryziterrae TaxID=1191699 RepID=UPI000366BDE6|nr:HAMP domain-containing protein [Calidifontibacillus oryziterrae]